MLKGESHHSNCVHGENIMPDQSGRSIREQRTIKVMIEMYCRRHRHRKETLCNECRALINYAMQRIEKCPFRADKPTCAKCPIHCYKAHMKEQVIRIMRYSGPRMMIYHPVLAMWHFIDQIMYKPKKNMTRRGN